MVWSIEISQTKCPTSITERKNRMEHKIYIHLSLKRIIQWMLCLRNLKIYAPNETDPLIDVVTDQSGNEIYVYIDNHDRRKLE